MPWPHDQARTVRGRGSYEAQARKAFYLARIPYGISAPRELTEVNSLRPQAACLAKFDSVSYGLQFSGHLARQHLDVARAKHPGSGAKVPNGLQRDRFSVLVERSARGDFIFWIEGGEIETMAQYENVGYEITATSRDSVGHVVTACAGIRIRRGDAIKRTISDQRGGGVGELLAGSF